MCGIIGAIAERNVTSILLECLKRLEYRGYDSAGVATYNQNDGIQIRRSIGKIDKLSSLLTAKPLSGNIGIAHTRWATHGRPTENNAHPHSSHNTVALVHNGIIENYQELRDGLKAQGYEFNSDTDTEVIAHAIHYNLSKGLNLISAVHKTVTKLTGTYALAIIHSETPDQIIVVRSGSPVVIGRGIEENFVASDALALLPVTNKFVYLEEGDIAVLERNKVNVYNSKLKPVKRTIKISAMNNDAVERGNYRHYMQKEIFEQPVAINETLEGRINNSKVLVEAFGNDAKKVFAQIKRVQIVACGSSYHAAIAGRYWIEKIAGLPCKAEIASEIRYRKTVVEPNTLFVTISQSGETADTLAALKQAKTLPYQATLAICNVPESSLVRESDLVFMTRAGVEVGVATTKAFTTQLVSLLLLTLSLAKYNNPDPKLESKLVKQLLNLPKAIEKTLKLDNKIRTIAKRFKNISNTFFLGRGINYPIAMEGALKLKEISYIHAEAFPAGELKHGPLALIDKDAPVIVLAPNDELLEKIKSNIHEVCARGGEMIIFTQSDVKFHNKNKWHLLKLPTIAAELSPIIFAIPLQLLSYHAAVIKGTDVDRPRNLAKSVTVE